MVLDYRLRFKYNILYAIYRIENSKDFFVCSNDLLKHLRSRLSRLSAQDEIIEHSCLCNSRYYVVMIYKYKNT